VVEVLACETIVLKPLSLYQMAHICYEIGNKHLPLFYDEDKLLIPYDAPVYRMLQASGFEPVLERRKLLNQFRTTVLPHTHRGERKETLFTRILKLTASADE
jgi:urease accessory protein